MPSETTIPCSMRGPRTSSYSVSINIQSKLVFAAYAVLAVVAAWLYFTQEPKVVEVPVIERVVVTEIKEVPVYVERADDGLALENSRLEKELQEAYTLLAEVADHSLTGWDRLESVQKDRAAAMAWANAHMHPYHVYDPVTGKARPLVDILRNAKRK